MPNHLRVDERIVYLEPGDSFVGAVQHLLDGWMSDLAIPPLDFGQAEPQRCQRSQITVTNALHFAAFDKSDEAMLNDYEELMGLLRTDEPVALDFSDIVLSFLTKDPVSLEEFGRPRMGGHGCRWQAGVRVAGAAERGAAQDPFGIARRTLPLPRHRGTAGLRQEPYNRCDRVRGHPHRAQRPGPL